MTSAHPDLGAGPAIVRTRIPEEAADLLRFGSRARGDAGHGSGIDVAPVPSPRGCWRKPAQRWK